MNMLKPFALRQLQAQLSSDQACIILSGEEKTRNHDVHYPFRASSDFKYICHLNEPECALLITKTVVHLFKMPYDEKKSLWTTGVMPFDQAKKDPLIDFVMHYDALSQYVNQTMAHFEVFAHIDHLTDLKTLPLSDLMGICRMFKHPSELELIRQAIHLSAHGHQRLMEITKPGTNEAELALEFMHAAAKHGITEQAYPPIVAGGQRACILHYTENNQVLKSGDLVLVDAGVELNGYASDITRTFPVNGAFSPEQKKLYEIVLAVQLHAIEHCIVGQTWGNLNMMARDYMLDQLLEGGVLSGSKEMHEKDATLSKLFYHGLGHWLGLDVHDPCPYRDSQGDEIPFQPGFVLTIEPGIYISRDSEFDRKWHQIGIRIEDDILITNTGPEVLSAHIPKTINEIEALCQK